VCFQPIILRRTRCGGVDGGPYLYSGRRIPDAECVDRDPVERTIGSDQPGYHYPKSIHRSRYRRRGRIIRCCT
jgi:hypothetical protein